VSDAAGETLVLSADHLVAGAAGDTSGIRWSFQLEEDDALRIRCVGCL